MSERIEEIRERLGKATPGPWRLEYEHCDCEYCTHPPYPYAINGPDTTHTMGELSEDYREQYGRRASEISALRDEDAELIANAPADLAFLLAEVERLEGELAKTKRGAVTLGKIIDRQGRAVLDITGLHHMVDEDMDGDWGAIWDILAEQAAKGRGLQEEKAEAWDEGRHFGQINDHAYPNDNPYRAAK